MNAIVIEQNQDKTRLARAKVASQAMDAGPKAPHSKLQFQEQAPCYTSKRLAAGDCVPHGWD